MKKYLIFTRRISDMGGAQLYVLRRCLHLANIGYRVYIIVTDHSDYFPLKEKFGEIPLIVIPEMKKRVASLSRRKQETIIRSIIDTIGSSDSYYIESHTLSAIEWGELVAAEIHARHLAYPLSEPSVRDYKYKPGIRIFEEKLDNGEFFGCSSYSLKEIFGRDDVPPHFINIGYDESELRETCIPSINIKKCQDRYTVLTISRLDKTYIEVLADAVSEMALKYPDKSFQLLIAGGCRDSAREDYLKNNYNNVHYQQANLDIRYLGYIDTLGRDIFKLADVFVGMGTASINAISQGCVTINIDPRNGMKRASGFFGIDTSNFAYPEADNTFSIFSKLEEAFLMNASEVQYVRKMGRRLFEEQFEINTCFCKIDDAINSIKPTNMRESLRLSDFYRMRVRITLEIRKKAKEITSFFNKV